MTTAKSSLSYLSKSPPFVWSFFNCMSVYKSPSKSSTKNLNSKIHTANNKDEKNAHFLFQNTCRASEHSVSLRPATMPIKGMRSVFFSTPHKTPSSPSPSPSSSSFQNSPLRAPASSPYNNSPLRRRPRIQTPIFSFSESMMVETLSIAEQMINKWNPDTSSYAKVTSLFYESRREAKEFIKSVNDLQGLMHFLITEDSNSEKLVRAHNLMQIAMKRLQKEFYQILSTNRAHLDPESISSRSSIASRMSRSRSSFSDNEDDVEDEIQLAGNSITEVENASRLTMDDLKTIADCMISNGYGKECVKIYKIIRKSIVDEGLYRLGVERLNAHRIHKLDWEVLELKHHNWINAVKIAVSTLFLGERILCDQVFHSSDSIRESCFTEITREGAMNLFLFPELVVMKSRKSSEDKIFRLLEQYSAISGVWPEIELIFSFESTSVIHSQALSSLISLSDTIRSMLSEFESSIQKDSSKSPVIGGGIHPRTQNAMSYISHLADYSGILSNIIISDWQLPVQTAIPESYFEIPDSDHPTSTISTRFAWLILVLLCKLDGKAELYKDVALSYLFLANNLHFVVTNVRRSNLQFLLGEQWISKQEAKVKQYTSNYQRLGWSTVLSTIPNPTTVTISTEEAKNYLKKFSSAFEEAYRSQSSWVVPDSKLRDEIKLSIYSNILPTYRAFFDKYRIALRSERNSQALIKFTPDDLGNYLSDLFYGTAISSSSSTATTTTTGSSLSSTHSPRVMKLRLEPRRCFSF